jgi:hypothetical protein
VKSGGRGKQINKNALLLRISSMNKPCIIANWKMNLDQMGIERFFSRFDVPAAQLEKAVTVI